VLMVGTDEAAVDAELKSGRLSCPRCASGLGGTVSIVKCVFDPGASRVVSGGRSAAPCSATHVLIPEDTLIRRRHGAEVIGAALTAKARGDGHRRIAKDPPTRFHATSYISASTFPDRGVQRSDQAIRALLLVWYLSRQMYRSDFISISGVRAPFGKAFAAPAYDSEAPGG
jgi:hypothetical protein